MTTEEFNTMVAHLLDNCENLLKRKGKEYGAENDRFYNFYRASAILDVHPMIALLGMKAKHDVSILALANDIASRVTISRKTLDEKVMDSINYLILFYALALEEADFKEKE